MDVPHQATHDRITRAPTPAAQLPLYKEVKRLLTQSLAEGEWQPGVALPSETRLGERYRVSIGTVRKAIDELVAERILVRHQGRGTFVASHNARRTLFHFFHIVPAEGGKEQPETELLSFERAKADAGSAARLNIARGATVFRIRNLLRLGGQAGGAGRNHAAGGALSALERKGVPRARQHHLPALPGALRDQRGEQRRTPERGARGPGERRSCWASPQERRCCASSAPR